MQPVNERQKDSVKMSACFSVAFGVLVWAQFWPVAAFWAMFVLLLSLEDIMEGIRRNRG